MEVTQEAILSLLIEGGGKVKNADMLSKFKGSLNCADPAEKKQNRDLFKIVVNTLAVVKEIEDVKYIVLKKRYQHLLKENKEEEQHVEQSENEELSQTGEQSVTREGSCPQEQTATPGIDNGKSGENEPQSPAELQSPVELALQRSMIGEVKLKKALLFSKIQNSDTNEDNSSGEPVWMNKTDSTTAPSSKPYALPLRMPPSTTRVEIHKLKGDSDDQLAKQNSDADVYSPYRNKRRPSLESVTLSSPQPRRAVKSTKPSEETREARFSSIVPLEQSEHEWLVKSASGHWSQVYGLLLRDNQLAEKKDFMSGFTALHWAAKCGNGEMVAKIIDISKQGGVELDINAKAYGGYTPLHIAALHNQEPIMEMLAAEYGADISVRDNCGKKARHYLHKETSDKVRELLGEPKVQENAQHEKEELDLFPDLSKGLHTISRLFQPHVTGHKKKHKQRAAFYSLGDDPRENQDESEPKHRIVSELLT